MSATSFPRLDLENVRLIPQRPKRKPQRFHRFEELPAHLRDNIIDAALPSTVEVQDHRKKIFSISKWYPSCGRNKIAALATINRQWQERVERLLFRGLRINMEDLPYFEQTCGTGPRSLLVQSLEVAFNSRVVRKPCTLRTPEQLVNMQLGAFHFNNHHLSLETEQIESRDLAIGASGRIIDQPSPVQPGPAALRLFDVLKRWDRSDLHSSHLLSLELCIYQNGCLDSLNFPSLPVLGEFIVHDGSWATTLHPSTSLSLIHGMPRLFHTNINLIVDDIVLPAGHIAAREDIGTEGSRHILQELPANLTWLEICGVSSAVFYAKEDSNPINTTPSPSPSIPISIAECGMRMNMLTQLNIHEVPHIGDFFRALARMSAGNNNNTKPWPNLRTLSMLECYIDDKPLVGDFIEIDQDHLVNEFLITIPQALGPMPRLEKLHIELSTPDPDTHSGDGLDLTLLRFPERYPSDSPEYIPHYPGSAALCVLLATELGLQGDAITQWKSAVHTEWSKELSAYQGGIFEIDESGSPVWGTEVVIVPWVDEEDTE